MASFGVYLASVATPIAKRVLAGLGIGVVTYVGLDVFIGQLKEYVILNWALFPPQAAQLLSITGFPDAIGIVLGAMATRFSMLQMSAFGRVQ